MADLTLMREALGANLATIPDLAESPYLLANATPPAVEIQPGPVEYEMSFNRGTDMHHFTIRVFVANNMDVGAQRVLDRMMAGSGDYSIKAAAESDPTLDGSAFDVHVKTCTGARIFTRDGTGSVFGAEWEVEVMASGD